MSTFRANSPHAGQQVPVCGHGWNNHMKTMLYGFVPFGVHVPYRGFRAVSVWAVGFVAFKGLPSP